MSYGGVEFQIHSPEEFQGMPMNPAVALGHYLDFVQLQSLFNLTAFWAQNRPIADLQRAVAHSQPVVSAWQGDRLVGFARATSDGVYRATIWDVIVHPDFQGSGIGRKLVETVLTHPHMAHVERVYLMTTHKQLFYEQVGFQVNPTTTMVLHNSLVALPLTAEFEELREVQEFRS
jgi:ribosomal protein S18 acetylase RimI-like enzyme